jgi:hypothetical protein
MRSAAAEPPCSAPPRAGQCRSHDSVYLEVNMDSKTNAVTGAALKHAIETRDGPTLTNFYAEDAVLRIFDRNNPPSRPREVKGKNAIGAFWDDICSRAMTHKVETSVSEQAGVQPGLCLSRRNEGALPRAVRAQSRQDRAPDSCPGVGRVTKSQRPVRQFRQRLRPCDMIG